MAIGGRIPTPVSCPDRHEDACAVPPASAVIARTVSIRKDWDRIHGRGRLGRLPETTAIARRLAVLSHMIAGLAHHPSSTTTTTSQKQQWQQQSLPVDQCVAGAFEAVSHKIDAMQAILPLLHPSIPASSLLASSPSRSSPSLSSSRRRRSPAAQRDKQFQHFQTLLADAHAVLLVASLCSEDRFPADTSATVRDQLRQVSDSLHALTQDASAAAPTLGELQTPAAKLPASLSTATATTGPAASVNEVPRRHAAALQTRMQVAADAVGNPVLRVGFATAMHYAVRALQADASVAQAVQRAPAPHLSPSSTPSPNTAATASPALAYFTHTSTSDFAVVVLRTRLTVALAQSNAEGGGQDNGQDNGIVEVELATNCSVYPSAWLLSCGLKYGLQAEAYHLCRALPSAVAPVPLRENGARVFEFARNGFLLGLQVLLERGEASVQDCDEDGWTPLHYACHNDRLDVARFLIDHGADKSARANAPLEWRAFNAVTPLAVFDPPQLTDDRVWDWTVLFMDALDFSDGADGWPFVYELLRYHDFNALQFLRWVSSKFADFGAAASSSSLFPSSTSLSTFSSFSSSARSSSASSTSPSSCPPSPSVSASSVSASCPTLITTRSEPAVLVQTLASFEAWYQANQTEQGPGLGPMSLLLPSTPVGMMACFDRLLFSTEGVGLGAGWIAYLMREHGLDLHAVHDGVTITTLAVCDARCVIFWADVLHELAAQLVDSGAWVGTVDGYIEHFIEHEVEHEPSVWAIPNARASLGWLLRQADTIESLFLYPYDDAVRCSMCAKPHFVECLFQPQWEVFLHYTLGCGHDAEAIPKGLFPHWWFDDVDSLDPAPASHDDGIHKHRPGLAALDHCANCPTQDADMSGVGTHASTYCAWWTLDRRALRSRMLDLFYRHFQWFETEPAEDALYCLSCLWSLEEGIMQDEFVWAASQERAALLRDPVRLRAATEKALADGLLGLPPKPCLPPWRYRVPPMPIHHGFNFGPPEPPADVQWYDDGDGDDGDDTDEFDVDDDEYEDIDTNDDEDNGDDGGDDDDEDAEEDQEDEQDENVVDNADDDELDNEGDQNDESSLLYHHGIDNDKHIVGEETNGNDDDDDDAEYASMLRRVRPAPSRRWSGRLCRSGRLCLGGRGWRGHCRK